MNLLNGKKKKKNILTAEQLQKKTQMDEKRKAQINKLADEQRRNVVEKILNVSVVNDDIGKQKER